MIDTIRLQIKNITEDTIHQIKKLMNDKITIDNSTGEILNCFTTGSLEGSYDYRISLKIKDHEYIHPSVIKHQMMENYNGVFDNRHAKLLLLIDGNKSNAPVKIPCPEYIEVEFSLAKWAYGVNYFNVPLLDDIRNIIKFRDWLGTVLNCKFPDLHNWQVLRLDMAKNYNFKNQATIRKYINLWRNLDYPRRKKPTFYADSLYIPGSSTTLKMYSKLPEFKKHDLKRVKKIISDKAGILDDSKKTVIKNKTDKILKSIEGVLRFEVEFHKRKLIDLGVRNVRDIFDIQWGDIMQKEMSKLIGEAPSGKVFSLQEVIQKINFAKKNGYLTGKKVTSDTVIAVWTSIVTHGLKFTQEQYNYRKVKRVRDVLKGLNISFLSTLQEIEEDKEKFKKSCDVKNFSEYTSYSQLRTFKQSTSWKNAVNY